jgi:glucan 1,3-beta-glucosidase
MQPWITPSLFEETGNPDVVDEWTFGQYQDPKVAQAKLTEHWDTWITESDFKAISAAGCVLAFIGASQCVASSFEFN